MKFTNYLSVVQNGWKKHKRSHPLQMFKYILPIKRLIIAFLVISISSLSIRVFAKDYNGWDLPEGAKMRIGKGYISDIKYSPDGNRLIVQSSIGFWIYDVHTGAELDYIPENPENILGLTPDASKYVGYDEYDTLYLRNLTDGSIIVTLSGDTTDIHRIAFSQDGQMLAGAINTDIHLWDLTTGERKTTLKGHTKWIWSIAFSPDGATLASGSSDNTLRLWDVATGSHKATLSKYTRVIDHLVFSPDGNTLFAVDSDGEIQVWDINIRKKERSFTLPSSFSIEFSPDGKTIVTSGFSGLYQWDIATGKLRTVFGGHIRWAGAIALSPDGTILASGGGGELFLWKTQSGERIMSIPGHISLVSDIAFSPNGNFLATSSVHELHLWDPTTGEYKKTIFGGDWLYQFSLTFSPDGNTLAGLGSSAIHLWDVSTGTYTTSLYSLIRIDTGNNVSTKYTSIAFSPDGQFLVAGNNKSTIDLWYKGRTYVDSLIGHTGGVTSIDFSHDNRLLVSGSEDRTVRLWDFNSRSNIRTFSGHTDIIHTVAFNPNASIVASGSQDNMINLWDVATGESSVIQTQHTEGVRSLKFSPNGNTLVSCVGNWRDTDTIIQVWDVATGEHKATLRGHTRSVSNISFSPDGNTLASGSDDGTVLLWDYNAIIGTKDDIQQLAEDVNRDGSVDLQDLILVASQFGQTGDDNAADINEDGVVDIADILLVAAALQNVNAAPSQYFYTTEYLTAAQVRRWLDQAQIISQKTSIYQKGIAKLEFLLTQLTPRETALLPNYPNPFNPETWIPYQLAKPADVTFHIYSADGHLVRTLALGNQHAGIYQSRSRAAYWDGKNEIGEPVASGIYFYTLSAGEYTATRRMVIRK